MTTPLPPAEPHATEGSALIEAGYPLDAVDVLRQAVAAGEPSGPDLLVRAYIESGSWHAAAEWLGPLVDRDRAEDMLRLAVESGELTAANDLAILLRDGDRVREAEQVLVRAADAGDPHAGANLVELFLEADDLWSAAAAAERYADASRPETLVALAEVRTLQNRLDEAERHHRRATELGALRAHSAYGRFLYLVRGDLFGAEREFREAQRRAEPGWAYTLGRFLLDDGRPGEAREYLQLAADSGDGTAAEALIELDGDPTDD
jgi:tetratricopeptide (TPR) repeat protein